MRKAFLKTYQTVRDLSSTVFYTLLIKASSPEADSMQKRKQTYAEKVRQGSRGYYVGAVRATNNTAEMQALIEALF